LDKKKKKKKKKKKYKDVIEFYWSINGKRQGIKDKKLIINTNILKQENYSSSALNISQFNFKF